MFEHLVEMRLAKCSDATAGRYTVFYRRKQMAMDFFIDKLISLAAKPRRKKLPRAKRHRSRRTKHDGSQGMLFK